MGLPAELLSCDTLPVMTTPSPVMTTRCGDSGLRLPRLTLGLWQAFGADRSLESLGARVTTAFDLGICAFDLADNYGPPPGAAESGFGTWFSQHFCAHRDEVIIATKAGHAMWSGPYGDGGSRKHLMAGIDQSLRRLRLDYVDIFYHHRPDPETPEEESWQALADIVRAGKALYVGLSKYPPEALARAKAFFRERGVPLIVHQVRYSLLRREPEAGTLQTSAAEGMGVAAFSVLAQGLLSERYLEGIPEGSRVASGSAFLTPGNLTPDLLHRIAALRDLVRPSGYSVAAFALRWALRRPEIATAVIGASQPDQIRANVAALSLPEPSPELYAQAERLFLS